MTTTRWIALISLASLITVAGVSVFTEPYSVAAPFVALASAIIINAMSFRDLTSKPNGKEKSWWAFVKGIGTNVSSLEPRTWQAIGATGLTVASLIWLTDAANCQAIANGGQATTPIATLVAFVYTTILALPIPAALTPTVLLIGLLVKHVWQAWRNWRDQ